MKQYLSDFELILVKFYLIKNGPKRFDTGKVKTVILCYNLYTHEYMICFDVSLVSSITNSGRKPFYITA